MEKKNKSSVILNLFDISSGEKLNSYFWNKWLKIMESDKIEEVGKGIDLLTNEMHEYAAKILEYGSPVTVGDLDYNGDKLVAQVAFKCTKK